MSGRVFIVHRWGGNPESDWYPYLRDELESLGFDVVVPEMPDSENPKIDSWVAKLKEIVGDLDRESYFVGHSVGCQTILRYLAGVESGKAGGAVFVAPWIHLIEATIAEEGPEVAEIARPWIETEIDFSKVRERAERFICIFSDNDSFVPMGDKDIFREMLGAETKVLHDRGHFSQDDGCYKLPEVLEEFSKL